MRRRCSLVAGLGAAALAFTLPSSPAQAEHPAGDVDAGAESAGQVCFDPDSVGAGARSAAGVRAPDHHPVTPEQQRAIERRTDRILAGTSKFARPRAQDPVTIRVFVHVMMDSHGNGRVGNGKIDRQIDMLNQTYAGDEADIAADTGFRFELASTDRFRNNTWHKDKSSYKYRKATRRGGPRALNIWLVDFKLLGLATFPWNYKRHAQIDGIRVDYASLPGGSIEDFDLGKTAVHETGHWLGLYHTFQGGCTKTGDEVDDTPAQKSASSGCPEGRDSCSLPGLDPIHNYMDYSIDACYSQFTPGQGVRMHEMFAAYRPHGPKP